MLSFGNDRDVSKTESRPNGETAATAGTADFGYQDNEDKTVTVSIISSQTDNNEL